MKLISFDVGIKNMAYCLFTVCNGSLAVADWQVVTMMNDTTAAARTTSCSTCSQHAKFKKDSLYFCKKHATKSSFWIPEKDWTEKGLKKKKKEELHEWCGKYQLPAPTAPVSKEKYIQCLLAIFQEKCLEPIDVAIPIRAEEINLVDLGRNMKRQLGELAAGDLTHVIIENQISPIATRMKTVQGMLAQYFIMRCENTTQIEFISAGNKLKRLRGGGSAPCASSYKQNKTDGIDFCSRILQQNPLLEESWGAVFSAAKKKDDYADCFLQGIWYLQTKNIIMVAEDLKINVL